MIKVNVFLKDKKKKGKEKVVNILNNKRLKRRKETKKEKDKPRLVDPICNPSRL
jgi:hypothetical protein